MVQYWRFRSFGLPRALEESGVRIELFSKPEPRHSIRVEPVSDRVTLIFGVGSKWTFTTSESESIETSAVCLGASCVPQCVINDDIGTCLEVSLPPWLASEMFSPAVVSTPTPLGIACEFGAAGKSLVEEVANSPNAQHAARAVARFLLDRQIAKKRTTRAEIRWAWKRLSNNRHMTVESLASEIGWSERHFANKYSEAVGCNPKRSIKLARFSVAYRTLLENAASIADVSASAGYYDQSHMIRDFREFAGLTPKQVRKQEAIHRLLA